MINLNRRGFMLGAAAGAAAGTLAAPSLVKAAGEGEVGPNGLHVQPWFHESFLDMAEDFEEAKAAGKDFAVIFEQRGCPYCREMHVKNFAIPEIADYIKNNFVVVQLDMWGSRETTDFDGETMEERDLARKWGVMYTPSISFFSREADVAGKSGKDAETVRMPGYFKPFHFISMHEFVHEGHWKDTHFQKYIQAKVMKQRESGGSTVPMWD
ncbi:MAG: thioredoxin [Hyphomicrobiales bacterium]|nr:MAG: thioredoxin [Hyphomicrobiales bacterium]